MPPFSIFVGQNVGQTPQEAPNLGLFLSDKIAFREKNTMKKTIKKTIRFNEEIHSLIEAYRENSKSGFSEAIENLVLKGLENSQAISNLKQIIKDEMKSVKEEVRNQGNRLAGININHFKFSGRIFAHTFSTYKGMSRSENDEIIQLEKQGISKALQDLKVKNEGETE